jgi:ankyrin repeat protein
VNRELIRLYWDIGREIVERQEKDGWGTGFIDRVAKDIQNEFPGIEGFSKTNMGRMRAFYLAYSISPQAVGKLEDLPIFNNSTFYDLAQLSKELMGKLLTIKNMENMKRPNTSDIGLIFAAKEGNLQLIKEFLDNGASITVANGHGNTALIMAAQGSNINVIELLMQKGAAINASNGIGNTPLIYASYNGHENVVKLLVRWGAQVDFANHQGNTALMYAAYNGHISIVKFLLNETNTNINATDVDSRTALMWAVIRGHEAIAAFLIKEGADPKIFDDLGNTALDWSKIMHRKIIEQQLTFLA